MVDERRWKVKINDRWSLVNLSFSFRTPSTSWSKRERTGEDRRLPTVQTRTQRWLVVVFSCPRRTSRRSLVLKPTKRWEGYSPRPYLHPLLSCSWRMDEDMVRDCFLLAPVGRRSLIFHFSIFCPQTLMKRLVTRLRTTENDERFVDDR